MNITIKATGLDLTPALKEFIEEKVGALQKLVAKFDENDSVLAAVEVSRTTKHHYKGDVFRAEINLELPHKMLRCEDNDSDIRVAIDRARDVLKREIVKYKETL